MGEADTEGDRHSCRKGDREEVERPERRLSVVQRPTGEGYRREGEAGVDRGEGAEISG